MRDLKCGLTDCKHNKNYACNAKKIEVTHSTDCATYAKGDKPKSALLFEAGQEFNNYSKDTQVHCTAPCLFAQKNKCIANGITVMGEQPHEAICVTFIKETD